MRLPRIHKARAGFTLIELLVVIGLILVLVGITVSVSYSGLIDGYKTVGAGDRASGWLLISKSKATREGAPRGVRFIIGPNNLIKEAQYIEVPDPFVPQPLSSTPNQRPRLLVVQQVGTPPRVFLIDTDFTAVINNVSNGDTLSISDAGTLHFVTGFTNSVTLTLAGGANVQGLEVLVADPSKLPNLGAAQTAAGPTLTPSYSTTNFGFIRKARPMLGEPLLQLTGDNAIDAALTAGPAYTPIMSLANVNISEGPGNFFIDVLFAPNGEVLNTTYGKTILWVRNTSTNPAFTRADNRAGYEAAGQMSLVVIYTKTGAISTQPVQLPQGGPGAMFTFVGPDTPYQFANDGINTGL